MEDARSIEPDVDVADHPGAREPRMEPPPVIGTDERRMHVRAYKFWVSLLKGRPLPPVEALDPANLPDFGPHGVLLDFRGGAQDPVITYLGSALRAESGIDGPIRRISDVPGRSLLSRLTDHYLQILANRAPIGFEAEFVNTRGNNTLYRGILMPFSSDGETIDFVYGAINWKEIADQDVVAKIAAEVGNALALSTGRAEPAPTIPVWADGPGTAFPAGGDAEVEAPAAHAPSPAGSALADRIASAQGTVDLFRSAEMRARSALYRSLGAAYDLSIAAEREPAEFTALLRAAGIRRHRRAPMTAVARLVFGPDHDRACIAEYAAVLAHGHRLGVAQGAMRRLLEDREGGLAAIVAAERVARRG